MLLESATISRTEFEQGTGWELKAEGACKGEICIPLGEAPGETVDPRDIAQKMNLPLVEEPEAGLAAIGPIALGGRALASADAPDFELPDINGNRFRLSSQKGKKIIVYAWAPY